jgi:hypothetical protein
MSEKSALISARKRAETIKLFMGADKIRGPNRESPVPHTEPTPSLYPFPAVGEKDTKMLCVRFFVYDFCPTL